jgi:aldehyde:ferredoxin oxidoreductase
VSDLEALQYANVLCNEDGMDPISFGATVGAAMELYDLGILTKEQDRPRSRPSAPPSALVELAEMTANGEGFGKEIGLGSKRAVRQVRPARAVHERQGPGVPGLRRSRGIQGMGLTYATSNRGACHLRSYTVASGSAGHPGQDRSAGHRRQGRSGQGLPGRYGRV